MTEERLTIDQAAAALGLTRDGIYRAIRRGDLPIRIDPTFRRRYLTTADLEHFRATPRRRGGRPPRRAT